MIITKLLAIDSTVNILKFQEHQAFMEIITGLTQYSVNIPFTYSRQKNFHGGQHRIILKMQLIHKKKHANKETLYIDFRLT
jgi:hypothetical protein